MTISTTTPEEERARVMSLVHKLSGHISPDLFYQLVWAIKKGDQTPTDLAAKWGSPWSP